VIAVLNDPVEKQKMKLCLGLAFVM